MKNKIILWLNLSFWFLLFGGNLFDQLVIAVNWKSGNLADIQHFHDFFRITTAGTYFYVKFGVLFFALVSLFYYWKTSKAIRVPLFIGLAMIFADMAFTILYFVPINIYLGGTNLDSILTKSMANSWFFANYFRIIISLIGLYVSARALHKSYLLRMDY